jgi:hypothetical protein
MTKRVKKNKTKTKRKTRLNRKKKNRKQSRIKNKRFSKLTKTKKNIQYGGMESESRPVKLEELLEKQVPETPLNFEGIKDTGVRETNEKLYESMLTEVNPRSRKHISIDQMIKIATNEGIIDSNYDLSKIEDEQIRKILPYYIIQSIIKGIIKGQQQDEPEMEKTPGLWGYFSSIFEEE